MFSAFTVLFIGYSHGDVVMQYLARSLGREGRRYVLADDADSADWSRLGLRPSATPSSMVRTPRSLTPWSVGPSSRHGEDSTIVDAISELVEQGPPTIPEEVSYLEQTLAHPERVRYFTASATAITWLQWAATRPQFNLLFTAPPTRTPPEAMARALTTWFIDSSHAWKSSSAALGSCATVRGPSDVGDACAPTVLPGGSDRGLADCLAGHGALTVHRMVGTTYLTCCWPRTSGRAGPTLHSCCWSTAPPPFPSRASTSARPTVPLRFEVTLTGEEYWLTEAWKKVFTPMLADRASGLLDLAAQQIRRMYRLAHLLQPGFDPIGLGRSAIEPHPRTSSATHTTC